ncbi:MAG: hypothetical protein HOA75_08020 [Deltaproteobacteria bacterium]|nr:hypothetical protein [Deltaproteobacteria bacterium]
MDYSWDLLPNTHLIYIHCHVRDVSRINAASEVTPQQQHSEGEMRVGQKANGRL